MINPPSSTYTYALLSHLLFLSNVGLRSLYTLISEGMADLEYLQVGNALSMP